MPESGEPAVVTPVAGAPATHGPTRLDDLRAALDAAREVSARNRAALETLAAETSALQQRTIDLRDDRAQRIEELRAAARRRRA